MWRMSPPPGSWSGCWMEGGALAKGAGKREGGDMICFRHRGTDLLVEHPSKKPQEQWIVWF